MVNIKVRIETGLTWEEDNLLNGIDTGVYKEVGGGKITLYVEHEEDISIISLEIQRVIDKVNDIRRALA